MSEMIFLDSPEWLAERQIGIRRVVNPTYTSAPEIFLFCLRCNRSWSIGYEDAIRDVVAQYSSLDDSMGRAFWMCGGCHDEEARAVGIRLGCRPARSELDLSEFEGMTDGELSLCVKYSQKGEAVGMARVITAIADDHWRRLKGHAKDDLGNTLASLIDTMDIECLTDLLPAEMSVRLRALYGELPPEEIPL